MRKGCGWLDQRGQSSLDPYIFVGLLGLVWFVGLLSFMAKSVDLPITASLKDGKELGVHVQVEMPLHEFLFGPNTWRTAAARAVAEAAQTLTVDEASKERDKVNQILGKAAAKAVTGSGSHAEVKGIAYAVGVPADQMGPDVIFLPVMFPVHSGE